MEATTLQEKQLEDKLNVLDKYALETSAGRVVFMPYIIGKGKKVRWDARIYLKGVAGHLSPSIGAMQRMGSPNPEEWYNNSQVIVNQLQALFPQMPAMGNSNLNS